MRRSRSKNEINPLKAFKVLGLSTDIPVMTFALAYIGYLAFGWTAILPFGLLGYFLGVLSMYTMIRQLEKTERTKLKDFSICIRRILQLSSYHTSTRYCDLHYF